MPSTRERLIQLSRLRLAATALADALDFSAPTDKKLEQFFRRRKQMGSRDRAFVAETVYGCLRHLRSLAASIGVDLDDAQAQAEKLAFAFAIGHQGWPADIFTGLREAPDGIAIVKRLHAFQLKQQSADVQADMPDWLWDDLQEQFGPGEARKLAAALNQPAPLDLRINPLKTARNKVAKVLAEAGFPATRCPWSPLGLRLGERKPLFQLPAFRDGLFEVQDEGSQLLSDIVAPKPGERVVDFCAGAGGKTLHMGALMENKGTLYAFDVDGKRLEGLKPRLKRSGLQNVRVQAIAHENDDAVKRLRGTIGRVLVDAPCSGSGTLRRNPDIKWRQLDLAALTALQQRILNAAAALVKPGGRLVYATCSLLVAENDAIAAEFAKTHNAFRRLDATAILQAQSIALANAGDKTLQLLPHRHGTDGFFAAVFERSKSI